MKRKLIVDTLVYTYRYADVVELVDTLALGASASGREGSSPFIRTKLKSKSAGLLFNLILPEIIICQGPSSASLYSDLFDQFDEWIECSIFDYCVEYLKCILTY